MGICWIIKQLSCSILRNIPWFSQLGLRPRRLSIRWYSARFHRIIVIYLPFPLTIPSNQNKAIVKKQLYAGKVPFFLTFVTIKRQYFELTAQEIKCQYSTADLCARSIIVSLLLIFSGLRKLWLELAYNKKYSSLNEQRYAWCGWIKIILIGRMN